MHINKMLMPASAFFGLWATLAGQYGILIILVAFAVVMDVITGLLRCLATGEAISSKKGTQGFWKKISLLFGVAFGFFLDASTPILLEMVHFSLPWEKTLLFGSIISCYAILNESISICENLLKANKKTLPKWLKKILQGAKEEIEKGGEKDNDKGTDNK